jgi:hypothetical protein
MCLNVASRRAWSRAGCFSGFITPVIPVMAGHRFRVFSINLSDLAVAHYGQHTILAQNQRTIQSTSSVQRWAPSTITTHLRPVRRRLSFDSYSMKSVHQTIESSHTHKSLEQHKMNQAYSLDNFVIHLANGKYSREKRVSSTLPNDHQRYNRSFCDMSAPRSDDIEAENISHPANARSTLVL